MSEPITKYVCCDCDKKHDDKDAAYECCPKDVLTIYACPHCNETWFEFDEAAECCKEKISTDPLSELRVPALVLEQYGQERLFL